MGAALYVLNIGLLACHATVLPETEVVLAHHHEDLSWLTNYRESYPAIKFTVYSKTNDSSMLPDGAVPLPNVGRESHTYLNHIVMKYNTLAPWTVFTQAGEPSFGYQGHRQGGGHLSSGWSFEDYFTQRGDSLFVVTGAVELSSIHHISRADYMMQLPSEQQQACPHDAGWSSWWRPDWFARHISHLRDEQGGEGPLEFYQELVAKTPTANSSTIVAFAQGARFAVSSSRIRTRPISYYQDLLFRLSHHRDPIASFYLEWMWFDVFHPESLQATSSTACMVPVLPTWSNGVVSFTQMMTDLRRRFGPPLEHMLEATYRQMGNSNPHAAIFEACLQCTPFYSECIVRKDGCVIKCEIDGDRLQFHLNCDI